MAASVEGIRALVEPSLSAAGEGFELWDVEVTPDTVRVLVDREGGIDLDALSRLDAKVISPLLDAHPELTPPGRFSLEVSSPGLERTLRRPEHFTRYVGREVAVKTKVAVEGSRRWQGVLRRADDGRLEVEPSEGPSRVTIALDQVERARTVLVWGPTAKPGQAKKRSGQTKKPAGPKASSTQAPARAQKQHEQEPQAAKRPAADGPPGAGQSVAFTESAPE